MRVLKFISAPLRLAFQLTLREQTHPRPILMRNALSATTPGSDMFHPSAIFNAGNTSFVTISLAKQLHSAGREVRQSGGHADLHHDYDGVAKTLSPPEIGDLVSAEWSPRGMMTLAETVLRVVPDGALGMVRGQGYVGVSFGLGGLCGW